MRKGSAACATTASVPSLPATEQQGAPVVRRYAASRGISSGRSKWTKETIGRRKTSPNRSKRPRGPPNDSQSCKTSTSGSPGHHRLRGLNGPWSGRFNLTAIGHILILQQHRFWSKTAPGAIQLATSNHQMRCFRPSRALLPSIKRYSPSPAGPVDTVRVILVVGTRVPDALWRITLPSAATSLDS